MTLCTELHHPDGASALPTHPSLVFTIPTQGSDFQLSAPRLGLRALPGVRHRGSGLMEGPTWWPPIAEGGELAPYLQRALYTTSQQPRWEESPSPTEVTCNSTL